MRVLVTGGAGFIGSNFVRLTSELHPKADITVLDALTYSGYRSSLADLDCTLVVGSICDADVVKPLVAEADVVVNFAAETHNDNSLRDPLPFIHTNVVGTATLLDAVRQELTAGHRVHYHHISTDEVFGDLKLDDASAFSESTPYRPSSPYSASKAGSDHLVRAWVRSFGIAATISNCSNNYGPFQHVEKFIPRQITNILTGQRPRLYGTGENVRDWIHVDDHNRAVWLIIEHGVVGQTYLIGARGEASNQLILETILDLMGQPRDAFDFVSDRPGHDVRYAIDPTRIEVELGFAPQLGDVRAGLAATIEWYRQNRDWWAGTKDDVEAGYARRERIIT